MTMSRWIFDDGATTYTVPRNPNGMTFPRVHRTFDSLPTLPNGRIPVIMAPQAPMDISFTGTLVDQTHHDALVDWVYNRSGSITITDHLSRTWSVVLTSFEWAPGRGRQGGVSYQGGTYTIKGVIP
jgi:hypothetical protein